MYFIFKIYRQSTHLNTVDLAINDDREFSTSPMINDQSDLQGPLSRVWSPSTTFTVDKLTNRKRFVWYPAMSAESQIN